MQDHLASSPCFILEKKPCMDPLNFIEKVAVEIHCQIQLMNKGGTFILIKTSSWKYQLRESEALKISTFIAIFPKPLPKC